MSINPKLWRKIETPPGWRKHDCGWYLKFRIESYAPDMSWVGEMEDRLMICWISKRDKLLMTRKK